MTSPLYTLGGKRASSQQGLHANAPKTQRGDYFSKGPVLRLCTNDIDEGKKIQFRSFYCLGLLHSELSLTEGIELHSACSAPVQTR